MVEQLTGGVKKLSKARGVTLTDGEASFVDERTLAVDDGEESHQLSFENAVVATGSRPVELPGLPFDDGHVLSSAHALALKQLPPRLVVTGAGCIGTELSTVFTKPGSDVTVVETLDDVLPDYEDAAADVVRERAEELDTDFRFGEGASDATPVDGGVCVTTESADGEEFEYRADDVVVAVGREPVTETLDLEAAEIETDDRGFVPTDERTRTGNDRVFAIGDVAGEPMWRTRPARRTTSRPMSPRASRRRSRTTSSSQPCSPIPISVQAA